MLKKRPKGGISDEFHLCLQVFDDGSDQKVAAVAGVRPQSL